MSLSPMPLHMSCFGVSSDAVNMVRGYSKPTYAERLSTVKNSISAACPETSAVASNISAGGAGLGLHVATQASSHRQSPQVKLQPLASDQAQQLLAGSGGAAGGHGFSSSASGTPSLQYRATTKHVKTVTPTLQALDFISIAVNSVGGGGVPRPYGKFQACRAGDGNATWQRLPPSPGSWQARALPIAVTLLGDGPPAPTAGAPRVGSSQSANREGDGAAGATPPRRRAPSSSAPASATATPDSTTRVTAARGPLGLAPQDGSGYGCSLSNGRAGNSSGGGGGSGSRGSGGGSAYRRSCSRTQPSCARDAAAAASSGMVSGPGAGLHEKSYYRRPGSSLHRSLVPLPPPEPHNLAAWFALPAATFLADVPDVPEQLRMDNGYSVSRQFLMSGLNPPRRPPPPPSPQHSTLSRPQAGPGAAAPGGPSGGSGSLYGQNSQGLPSAEDSLALWNSMEASAAAAAAAAAAAQYGAAGGDGSPARLRGVYVPLEKRGQDLSAESPQPLPLAASGESGPMRRSLQLPPEMSLPRRKEPTGW